MDTAKLDSIRTLLRLIHHRNKNQHGNTKWWKWLAILNRAVSKLVRAVEREDDNPLNLYSPEPTAPADADADVDADVGVDVYKEYLAGHIIPRCYLAFSTVVADNQFAVLGVVLVSVLADLASVVGGVRLDTESLLDTHGHAVNKDMEMEVTGKDEDKDKDRLEVGLRHPHAAAAAAAEDVGEVVFRGNDAPESTSGLDSAPDPGSIVSGKRSTGSGSEGPSKRKKKSKENVEGDDTRKAMEKKKRKKKNTIDDLFNGVL